MLFFISLQKLDLSASKKEQKKTSFNSKQDAAACIVGLVKHTEYTSL